MRRLIARAVAGCSVGLVLSATLLASCSDNPTKPSETKGSLSFFDDFSSDIGWINETGGDFTISGGQLIWKADRSKVQRMYIPIAAYSGDFQMEFDFVLTHRENNIWLEVGLVESLAGGLNDPVNDPVGTFIQFGWQGGDASSYYIFPMARYHDRPFYYGGDPRDYATYITYSEDNWFHLELEVVGRFWRLTVESENEILVGQRTGSFPTSFGTYRYIYIGNSDDEDWPIGEGSVDDLQITDQVNWDDPCPDFPCATPSRFKNPLRISGRSTQRSPRSWRPPIKATDSASSARMTAGSTSARWTARPAGSMRRLSATKPQIKILPRERRPTGLAVVTRQTTSERPAMIRVFLLAPQTGRS